MSDHSELQKLAAALLTLNHAADFGGWAAALDAFEDASGPDVVMALLAEVQALSEHKQHMVQLREADGFESWSAVLVKVDQLKAEVERLQDLSELHALEMSGVERAKEDLAEKLGCADEPRWKCLLIAADDLRAEVAGLNTGYAAHEEEAKRLRGEVESANQALFQAQQAAIGLSRDAERYRWLRHRITKSQYFILGAELFRKTCEGVDFAVDAVMRREASQ